YAARVGTAASCHFGSAACSAAAGTNGLTAGASESTIGPAVMHAGAHGHSHGSPAGGGGTLPAGSAARSLQIGSPAGSEAAASAATPSPERIACRAMT